MLQRSWLAVVVLMLSAALSGCGDDALPLTEAGGAVTLAGAPVAGASVVFRPAAGPSAMGQTDAAGRFVLSTYEPGDGAVIGTHTVTIVPASAGVALVPGQPPAPPLPAGAAIPPRYARPESSGLAAEIQASANDFAFDLVP